MPEVTAPYPPGTPCWVALRVPDPDAALGFYHALFGWERRIGPPERGGPDVCVWHGRPVAGIGPAEPLGRRPAPPPAWTTYLCTDDADDAARAVTANGGTLLLPPRDAPGGAGRTAVATDPSGALFGLWQPAGFPGAGVVGEPGALVWNELDSRDPGAAAAFYPRVLGVAVAPYRGMAGYFTFDVRGRPVAGLQQLGEGYPPGTPSHWLPYFAVADADTAVETVIAADGSVLAAPADTAAGRTAVAADPQGGVFAVIAQPPAA